MNIDLRNRGRHDKATQEEFEHIASALRIPEAVEGSSLIANGAQIEHGLGETPRVVLVTPSVAGEMAAVTLIGRNKFTVALTKHDNTAGTIQRVYWRAVL